MSSKTHPSRRTTIIGAALMGAVIAAVGIASCEDTRPSMDEWESEWRSVVAQIPAQDDVSGTGQQSLCDRAVAVLRRAEADLVPAPNDDLDAAVLDWVEFTDAVFFDCPLLNGEHAGFAAGYEEIDRLAAEIEALITFEKSLQGG